MTVEVLRPPTWTGRCVGPCARENVTVQPRRTHGDRMLCDDCAERPFSISTTGLDAPAPKPTRRTRVTRSTTPTTTAQPASDAVELAKLLALDTLDPPLTIAEASVIGDGADATAYISYSDDTEMSMTLREMCSPSKLMAEVVATTGAVPKLNQQRAMQAVALLKRHAQHIRSMSETDEAVEWGVNFLQAAETIDVDLMDQGERWAAFSKLAETDPRARHRECNISVAAASIVLRGVDGTRLVRTDWMRAYVRSIEPRTTPAQIAALMQRVGWQRRGKEGRWKATRPGLPGQLNWSFWIVPKDWDDRGAVTAGKESPPAPAHTPTHARVETVTSRNQVTEAAA